MADWPYSTARWQRLRLLKLQTSPLCEDCLARDIVKGARAVDHRMPISMGGEAFPPLEELAALCIPCHSRKTARGPEAGAVKARFQVKGCDENGEPLDRAHQWNGGTGRLPADIEQRRLPTDLQRSLIPLTIVCGPPGSGKSTYVREHAGPHDLVICLDTIMAKLSGRAEHDTDIRFLPRAMKVRNVMLRSLAKPGSKHPAAWFIVSAPSPTERRRWAAMLGGKLVVMDTQPEECVRRIKADASRAGHEGRMIEAALKWWERNPSLRRQTRTTYGIGKSALRQPQVDQARVPASP